MLRAQPLLFYSATHSRPTFGSGEMGALARVRRLLGEVDRPVRDGDRLFLDLVVGALRVADAASSSSSTSSPHNAGWRALIGQV